MVSFGVVILPNDTTFIENEHDCPPIFKAKVVVPTALGVPLMAKVKVPAPLANNPSGIVAVRPVTPVEEMACAG